MIVFDVLKAGEVSLHSDLLLHGSAANDSDPSALWAYPTLLQCSDVHADSGLERKGCHCSWRKILRGTGLTIHGLNKS